ncbi:TetR/AcrR family transcriptional regulator [Deinococcus oregonensis]|uniref:TetR/AcrR family transcriptional regulator n=1 Tax=Deinococcus oregonensis TaxID=1805970 RepID=A0ABV6AUB3_9DEIO
MRRATDIPAEQAAKRGAGRPRRTPDQPQTRDQALDAAEYLLETQGYVGASMSDVARAVGISKPALYHHFPTKETLFLGVAQRLIERDAAGMAAAIASGPAVTGQLEALAAWMFGTGRHTERMLRDAVRFLEPQHAELIAQKFTVQMLAQVEQVMRVGIETSQLEPHDATLSAWAFMGLLSVFTETHGRLARSDLPGELVRLIVNGIGPR